MTTPAFIDLASFNNIEKELYQGNNTFLCKSIEKSDWFTTIPFEIPLTSSDDNKKSYLLPRTVDYISDIWIESANKDEHIKLEEINLRIKNPNEEEQIVVSLSKHMMDMYNTFTEKARRRGVMRIPFFFARNPFPIQSLAYSKTYVDFIGDITLDFKVFVKGIVVNGHHRHGMATTPITLPIEQSQTITGKLMDKTFSIRMKYPIKVLFFKIWDSQKKEYISLTKNIELHYGRTKRMDMSPEYYSYIEPSQQPNAVCPEKEGYYMYSYANDFVSLQPTGSTNYSDLGRVYFKFNDDIPEDHLVIVVALNHNVMTIKRGCVYLDDDVETF